MIYPRATHYIAAFLRRKWEHCRGWADDTLLAYVQWFVNHDRVLFVTDRGRIAAVAFYRLLHDAHKEAVEHYVDSNGPVAFIEVCASRTPGAMRAAFDLLRLRESGLTHLAYVRGKCSHRETIIPIGRAARLL